MNRCGSHKGAYAIVRESPDQGQRRAGQGGRRCRIGMCRCGQQGDAQANRTATDQNGGDWGRVRFHPVKGKGDVGCGQGLTVEKQNLGCQRVSGRVGVNAKTGHKRDTTAAPPFWVRGNPATNMSAKLGVPPMSIPTAFRNSGKNAVPRREFVGPDALVRIPTVFHKGGLHHGAVVLGQATGAC
jgi:hypothetical protein